MSSSSSESYLLSYIRQLHKLLDENEIYYPPLEDKPKSAAPDTNVQIDLSEVRIEELVDKYYTEELFNKGYKGVVEFIYSYIVRDDDDAEKILYICGDQQKKIFHYYDEEGLQRDTRCKVLLDSIYEPLIKKVNKLYRVIINKIYSEEERKEESESEDESDSEDYDSDIEEVIAEELKPPKENSTDTTDDKVNLVVSLFLEIKKSIGKMRKPIVDDLVDLLAV